MHQVREAAYRIFLHPDQHQIEILDYLLSARNQLAKLVGFETYSHRANKGTMIESPGEIRLCPDLAFVPVPFGYSIDCLDALHLHLSYRNNILKIWYKDSFANEDILHKKK